MSLFRKYIDHKFKPRSLELIAVANAIIADYDERGLLPVSIRQLHYRMTEMADYANTQANYNMLVSLISKARDAGLVSWTAVEDRERGLKGLGYNEHPHELFQGLDQHYRRDKWADQPWRPEFWVEKKAQEGIIGRIADEMEVDYFATRGYNSHSESWRAAQRFSRYIRKGQRPIIFYVSDLDWAGLDMHRDIQDKLERYCGTPIIVQRLALTIDQVEEFNLPDNPVKDTDVRIKDWAYGDKCWELDAHHPEEIQKLFREAVEKVRDPDIWDASLAREVEEKVYVQELISRLGLGGEDEEDEE